MASSSPPVIGDLVAVPTARGRAFGIIHGLRQGRRADESAAVEVQLLGELVAGRHGPVFSRGVTAYPPLDAPMLAASDAEINAIYARPRAAHLQIGCLRHDESLPAYLATDHLLGKNFAVLGSSGSGKSCAVTVILRSLLDCHPYAHVLVLDPHNEYATAFGDRALRLDPSNLELPYWLLTFEEIAVVLTSGVDGRAYGEGVILRDAILRAKQIYRGGDADQSHDHGRHPRPLSPVGPRPGDRGRDGHAQQARGGHGLSPDPGAAAERPRRSPLRLHVPVDLSARQSRRHPRPAAAPAGGRPAGDHPRPLGRPVGGGQRRRLAALPADLRVRALVGARATARLCCSSARRPIATSRPTARPCSSRPAARSTGSPRRAANTASPCAWSASGRPSCRPAACRSAARSWPCAPATSATSSFVRNALPDGFDWLIAALPALATGEAVIAGEGVSVPMQVQFRPLAPEEQPASQTPAFSRAWSREVPTRPSSTARSAAGACSSAEPARAALACLAAQGAFF